MNYTEAKLKVMREYGFSPRMALEYTMERHYHGYDHDTAKQYAEYSADRYYRERAIDIAERMDRSLVKGYSLSQVTSVMAVLETSVEVAKDVCNLIQYELDWSEATWEEIWRSANDALEALWEGYDWTSNPVTETGTL